MKHRQLKPAYLDYWQETKCQKSKVPENYFILTGNIHTDSV
jgi:hypothetical protein